jgi:hypothetical protein
MPETGIRKLVITLKTYFKTKNMKTKLLRVVTDAEWQGYK